MGKKEDLDKLDKLVREQMIKCLEGNRTDELSDLSVPVSYLAKNNVTAEKPKTTQEEDIQKRLSEAEKRRGEKK